MKIKDIKEYSEYLTLPHIGLLCMFIGLLVHGSLIAIGMIIIVLDQLLDDSKEESEQIAQDDASRDR